MEVIVRNQPSVEIHIEAKVVASLENYDDTEIKDKLTELEESVGQNTASISSLAANKADKEWVTEQIVDSLPSQVYGVEWYTGTVTSPAFTEGQTKLIRIGNLNLHHSLPVQSKMRGCLLDDEGNVVKYLNPNNWKQDDLSGASGQVMVEIPDFFIRYTDTEVSEGISRRAVEISLLPFDGSQPVKKCYIGAYEASLDGDGKLSSMAGVLPKTAFSMTGFRTAARKRNTSNIKWNILPYEQYKVIFWLYTIEYANRYSQMAVDNSLDDNGYHQGGLGIGMTNISNWRDYNSYYPFVVAGSSDSLGNESGEVTIPTSEYVNNEVTLATGDNLVHVNRYRGIELPFGHIFKFIDGVRVYAPDDATDRTVYTTDDVNKFIAGDASIEGWTPIGNEVGANGYVKELIFGSNGEIICAEIGGGSTTYWTDYHYIANTGLRAVVFGGVAFVGADAGFVYSYSYYAPSDAYAYVGSRLCFIP